MRFEILKEHLVCDSVSYSAFGIVCIEESNLIHTFSDITYDFDAVKSFADTLNTLKPDFSQLEYIIEDFCLGQD